MKGDNKIGIPWYRRNVKLGSGEEGTGINSVSSDFNFPKPNPVRPQRPQPVRQPVRSPVRSPVTSPVPSPVTSPIPGIVPVPAPSPFPSPTPFPTPIPFPGARPTPIPDNEPSRPQGGVNPPIGSPSFPAIPSFNDPNYDWAKHWQNVINSLPKPEPNKNPFQKGIEGIINPVITLFVANEVKNKVIEVSVTDPIYQTMLKDPTLGLVLREAEKSNLDMDIVATYFANYNWDNVDLDQMTTELTSLLGVAGAARLLILVFGRKVAFRL